MGKASLGIRWAGNIAELEKPESSSRSGRRGDFFASELPVTHLKASKILKDGSLYCDCNRQFLVEVSFFLHIESEIAKGNYMNLLGIYPERIKSHFWMDIIHHYPLHEPGSTRSWLTR